MGWRLQQRHIIQPIQTKSPGLIRSEGRFRQEPMRRRLWRFAFPKQESTLGNSTWVKAE